MKESREFLNLVLSSKGKIQLMSVCIGWQRFAPRLTVNSFLDNRFVVFVPSKKKIIFH